MTRHTDLLETWLHLPSVPLDVLQHNEIAYRAAQLVGGVRRGPGDSLLLPAWNDPPSVYHTVPDPVLLGVVDVDLRSPDRCMLRPEDAPVIMLGEVALREARWFNEPLPVFRNPLNWLRSGGGGVFPLDTPAFINEVLWAGVELVAEDVAHGEMLERHLEATLRAGKPRVSVWRAAA